MNNQKMRLGFGTWMNVSSTSLEQCIAAASEVGYNYIDTAHIYGNESQIGKALSKLKKSKKPVDLPIQSKVWVSQFDDVKKALSSSLKKLNQTKIWSYLLHRPHLDMNKTIQAWKQLIKCKELGMVENIGVSNFDKDMIKLLIAKTGVKPWCNQIELSVNNFREDRLVFNNQEKIAIQAWSPLGVIEKNLKNPILVKLAKKYKTDVPGILIAFLNSQNIPLIVKSSQPERVISNVNGMKIKLTKTEIATLRSLNTYENKAPETYYDRALELN